jgi:hypothetical protein
MREQTYLAGLKPCLTVDLLRCGGAQDLFQYSNLHYVFLQASKAFLGAMYFCKHRIELADTDRFQCLANFAIHAKQILHAAFI